MTRRLVRCLGAAILGVTALLVLSSTAAAQTPPVGMGDLTQDRLRAFLAMLVSLLGVVSGGFALRSAVHPGNWLMRNGPVLAIVAGLVGGSLGGLLASTAAGGLGTGHGLGGGVVALALGLIAIGLGALGRTRSRDRASR
jgi:uncharacterized protein DUF6223